MRRKGFAKKMAASVTTAAMAVSMLAGCGGTEPDAPASDEPKDQAQEEQKGGTEDGSPFDFESVQDVTFPLEEKLTFTVFVNESSGKIQDCYVTDWIEEKTNIHLDFVYDVTGEEAKTKLNLLMTDPSSLPDIFWATGWTKAEVQNYGTQGLLLPLNDYLEDAPNWNAMNEESPARKGDLIMGDGNIYTYGQESECFHVIYQNRVWIYKPWVDQLMGGKIPETTEELYEFLTKVKTEDPNGNGIADEIPMSGYIGGWSSDPTVWLLNAFVQCNNPLSNTNPVVGAGLVVNDGKVEYAPMKEEYREGVRYINKLFQEGLLDNQTFTQDENQYAALLDMTQSEDEGEASEEKIQRVAVYASGGVEADSNFWSNKPGAWEDWEVFEPIEGPGGVRLAAKGQYNYFANAIGILSQNCKYPEIAVALFDFLATEEATLVQSWGPEGVGWEYNSEGVGLTGETSVWNRIIIDKDYDWVGNFGKDYSGNVSYTGDAKLLREPKRHRDGILVEDPNYNTEYYLQGAAQKYEKYAPKEESLIPNLIFEGEDAQIVSEGTVTIGGYVNQALVRFITGDMDIDGDWDGYIQKLEEMGVSQYLEVYQRSYDSYMENLK